MSHVRYNTYRRYTSRKHPLCVVIACASPCRRHVEVDTTVPYVVYQVLNALLDDAVKTNIDHTICRLLVFLGRQREDVTATNGNQYGVRDSL